MKNDYIIIPGTLLRNSNLSMMQRLLLAKAMGLDNDKGCYASNQYFADSLGVTKDYISKALNDLKKKGYISIQLNYKKDTKEVESRTIRCISDTYRIDVLEGIGQKAQVKVKKEYKEEKESFDLFWIAYPRKTGKQKAWTFWKKNYAKLPLIAIMGHCKKAYVDTEKTYIPHPFTYLNQERYYDEIVKPVEKKNPINLGDYKRDTTGFPMAYCCVCNKSASYKEFEITSNVDSRCCNAKLLPKRRVSYGEYQTSINSSDTRN